MDKNIAGTPYTPAPHHGGYTPYSHGAGYGAPVPFVGSGFR